MNLKLWLAIAQLAASLPPPVQKPLGALETTTAAAAAAAAAPATAVAPVSAATPLKAALAAAVDAHPLLALHRDLVRIPSISNNETAVGAWLASYLEKAGFVVETQPVPPPPGTNPGHQPTDPRQWRFNVLARAPGGPATPAVLMTSHIDTVPPYIPYSVSYDREDEGSGGGNDNDNARKTSDADSRGHRNDWHRATVNPNDDVKNRQLDFLHRLDLARVRLHGRGSDDAKGAVAAQVTAVRRLVRQRPDVLAAGIGLLFVVGEENGGSGMKAFSDSRFNAPAAASWHTVIFGEPTELSLVAGHKGGLAWRVHATGRAAHSGYPWLGVNAIEGLLPLAARLARLGDQPVHDGGLPASDVLGNSTVNLATIAGGVATNVVPESAEVEMLARLAAGTPDEAAQIVRRAVAAHVVASPDSCSNRVTFDLSFRPDPRPAVRLDADVPGFPVIVAGFNTDVTQLAVRPGVRRQLYGPGTISLAHSANESITALDLVRAVEGYERLVDDALERAAAVRGE